jgi:hypothetical protein
MKKPEREDTRTRGRPARQDSPARLVVRVSGELKRWLAHRAIDEDRDMGRIVAEALETYRKAVEGRRKP